LPRASGGLLGAAARDHQPGRDGMTHRGVMMAVALIAVLGASDAGAQAARAQDHQSRYPDFYGQWSRTANSAQWDPSKPPGLRQQPPLAPAFQAMFESNVVAVVNGDQAYNPQAFCIPPGMPRMMIAYEPLEMIVTPETTYIRIDHLTELRRIYTDGRAWPAGIEPSFEGYSIGRWIDSDGSGSYDMLEVETRALKGPRNFDHTGIPLHPDNQTIVKERFYLDQANHDLLHDEITTFDHALTRPWTVTRHYVRERDPIWLEFDCAENNSHVVIGKESYFLSHDGYLMPTRKDQPPPEFRQAGESGR
jgi:hypothetical protein